MEVYLLRHGTAYSAQENPARPLTPEGREEVEAIAKVLKKRDLFVDVIYHSSKTRARETAEILASILDISKVEEAPYLQPGDSPSYWEDQLRGATSPVMLVGHLPHLGSLAAKLLGKKETEAPIFLPATCVAIEVSEEGEGKLKWILHPREAKEIL